MSNVCIVYVCKILYWETWYHKANYISCFSQEWIFFMARRFICSLLEKLKKRLWWIIRSSTETDRFDEIRFKHPSQYPQLYEVMVIYVCFTLICVTYFMENKHWILKICDKWSCAKLLIGNRSLFLGCFDFYCCITCLEI